MNIFIDETRAVLFDRDGVIVDSEPLHVKALDLTCRHFGFELLPEDIVRFKVTEKQAARYFLMAASRQHRNLRSLLLSKAGSIRRASCRNWN